MLPEKILPFEVPMLLLKREKTFFSNHLYGLK